MKNKLRFSETKVKYCFKSTTGFTINFSLSERVRRDCITSTKLYVNSLALYQEVILQRTDGANNFNTSWLFIRCGSVYGPKIANIGVSSATFLFLSLANDEGLAFQTSASLSFPSENLALGPLSTYLKAWRKSKSISCLLFVLSFFSWVHSKPILCSYQCYVLLKVKRSTSNLNLP